MSAHLQLLTEAKRSFAFLTQMGFRITSEKEGDYSSFRQTFFEISYRSPAVSLNVTYYDLELNVAFESGSTTALYLFLDRNLYANASGMAGTMFSDVPSAIKSIAQDIGAHYKAILQGEPAVWQQIKGLVSAPPTKRRFLP